MNKAKFVLLAASLLFAILFPLSCSSGDDTPTLVNCITATGCLPNSMTADQCNQAGGEVTSTCPADGGKVDCTIAGTCMPNTFTAVQCTASGGTVGCGGNPDVKVDCMIAGTCMPNTFTAAQCTANNGTVGCGGNPDVKVDCMLAGTCMSNTLTAAQCTASGGTVGCGSNPDVKVDCMLAGTCVRDTYTAALCVAVTGTVGCGNNNPIGSCIFAEDLACIENVSRSDCDDEEGAFAVSGSCSVALFPYCMGPGRNCATATEANKAACFNNDKVLVKSELCKPTPVAYCDYGLPHSAGGGCFPIFKIEDVTECDAEYGKLRTAAEGCGRTDLSYCRYGNGECYNIANNSTAINKCTITDSGTNYNECPLNTFVEPFYCYDGDGYGDCDRIGVYYNSAKSCIQSGGMPLPIQWCDDIGADVFE
jgi:hypothetical protein